MRNHRTLFGVGVLLVSLWGAAGPALPQRKPRSRHRPGASSRPLRRSRAPCTCPASRSSSGTRTSASSSPRSATDGAGQVTFPDVPIGRYVITASGPGFVNRDSTVFVVRANETAQVILDAQLTFVLPGVQVRADTPSPTDSVQPVSMSDMLSGSLVRDRAARGRRLPEPAAAAAGGCSGWQRATAHQGRAADAERAADQQRQPDRPVVGRFRPRSAVAVRGLGRGDGEPVRRRIWAIHHEHHADPHQRRAPTTGTSRSATWCRDSADCCAAFAGSSPGRRCAVRSGRTASSSRRISSSAT